MEASHTSLALSILLGLDCSDKRWVNCCSIALRSSDSTLKFLSLTLRNELLLLLLSRKLVTEQEVGLQAHVREERWHQLVKLEVEVLTMVGPSSVVFKGHTAEEHQEFDVLHLVRLGWVPDRILNRHHALSVDSTDVQL